MHGWLALPLLFQGLILLAAPVLGVVGAWANRSVGVSASKMALYAACYSVLAIAIAHGYQATKYPGSYSAGPWVFLTVLLFPLAFAAISVAWIIAHAFLGKGRQEGS